jgi:transaldolase
MKIFLDTADLGEIQRAADAGLIDGVTTNPSLVAKVAEGDVTDMYREICQAVDGPVSLEVVAIDRDSMVSEGRKLAAIHANAVVKVPLTEDGLKACRDLVNEGHRVNVTLCFSVSQALLAAKSGATFVSPFVGRIGDPRGVDSAPDARGRVHAHRSRLLHHPAERPLAAEQTSADGPWSRRISQGLE